MSMKMDKKSLILFSIIIQALVLFSAGPSFSTSIGEPFPPFTLTNTLDSEECAYLEIDCEKDFSLNALHYDVIVSEILNVYCDTCRLQVELFNDLFLKTKKDPDLFKQVCLIGIAASNSFEEVWDFKEKFGAHYPIIADPQKRIFTATGNIHSIPHTDILRKEGKHYVLESHTSGASSMERYLSIIKFALRGTITGVEPGNKAPEYSFVSGGKSFDKKSFEGKRVILYFPVDRKYPLAIDTRNTENQIKILHKILNTFPDVTVILFKYPDLSSNAQNEVKSSSFYIVEQAEKNPFDTLRSPDEPTLYYLNEFGRIAFKGEAITLYNAQKIIEGTEYAPKPDMEEEDIVQLIEERIKKSGKKAVVTEKLIMDDEKAIYVTTISPRHDKVYLFSRLEISPSLCDVCHDSHFIYIMDQEGIILDFIPVQLTKMDNIAWSEKDVRKVKDSVVGRSIFEDFPFNPKVDAVSTATLTSSQVFEAFNQGKNIFGDFKYYNFRWGYWKQVCFKNYCKIKQKIEQIKKQNKDFILNNATLDEVISEYELPGCPLHGKYLVVDGDIACSVFGLHLHSCEE